MSYTEPNADAVQPEAGQGDAGAAGSPPYADYLTRVPEEVRGDIEPIFKEWDSNVSRKFSEHATYRKQWEPYEQAGINQYTADQLQWAIQTLSNPDQARQWLDQTYGPVQQQETPQEPNPYEYHDPQQQALEQLLTQKLGPLEQQLQQFNDWRTQLEQQQHEQHVNSVIMAEIEKLHQQHLTNLPEPLREKEAFADLIDRLGSKYATAGADPVQVVQRTWADFQALQNQFGTAAIQGKLEQPAPAVEGGTADLSPEKITSLREASRIALQQMRANRAA